MSEVTERKTCYLIGTFSNDKIKNELYLNEIEIISKNLTSSPRNWDSVILDLTTKSADIDFVVFSLTESILLIAQCEGYKQKFDSIIELICQYSHILFLYEDNCFSKFNIFEKHYYQKYLYYNYFWSDKNKYAQLVSEYKSKSKKKDRELMGRYFLEVALPAYFFAEKSAWVSIFRQDKIICNAIEYLATKYNINIDGFYSQYTKFVYDDTDEYDAWDSTIDSSLNFFDHSMSGQLPFDIAEDADFFDDSQSGKEFERAFTRMRSLLQLSNDDQNASSKEKAATDIILQKCELALDVGLKDTLSSFFNFIILLLKNEEVVRQIDCKSIQLYEWMVFPTYRKRHHKDDDIEIKRAIKSINSIIDELYDKDIRIVTYKSSTEIVRCLREFVSSYDDNVLFKQYVLHEQPFANEFESFLSLFQDYVIRIRGIDVSFEKRTTDVGIIYVIVSKDKDLFRNNFHDIIDDFKEFISQCDKDEERIIRNMLVSYGLDEGKIDYYIAKFQKNTRRIKVDIRQELERRMMDSRHAIENEVMENESKRYNANTNSTYLEQSFSSLINNDCFIRVLDYNGDYIFNELDNKLIEYIRQFSEDCEGMITELRILKDYKAGDEQKRHSYEKLRSFLNRIARSLSKNTFDTLTNYLSELLF